MVKIFQVHIAGLFAALLLSPFFSMPPACAQTIWFSPRAGPQRVADFMDLFEPNAPWQRAAAHVKVFEISQWMSAAAPEAELIKIFSDLRRRHIALGVGLLPLSPGPNGAGKGIEGYSAPGQPLRDAKRLKALGADVAYYGFDEPLYFGHEFKGTKKLIPCHSPIADIAKDVALKVKQVRTVFPAVPVGDVEPFPVSDTWLAKLAQWFDAYEAATGEKLAFFRLDMQWQAPWQAQIPALAELLRRKGIPLQVIYNGSGNAASDEEWIAQAIKHFQEFESEGRPVPDAVAIQCWTPRPSRLLPETDPRTLTSLINEYVKWKRSRH